MTRRPSESGFTLLEILVASMLLAMLITILTMVFNSSSIAWSTGKASVAEMDEVRQKTSSAGIVADNVIPRVDVNDVAAWGQLVGPWRQDADGTLRRRTMVKVTENELGKNVWGSMQPDLDMTEGKTGKGEWVRNSSKMLWVFLRPGNIKIAGGTKDYVVGVWSLGPDGKPNSGDDISTWPDSE